jgi:hypothetical protein
MDSYCKYGHVTYTQYLPFNLSTLSYRLDQTYYRMIQMIGNINFPRAEVVKKVIAYKDIVRKQVPVPDALESTSIVLVFAVREGHCTVTASWLIHDGNGAPVCRSDSTTVLLKYQAVDPDQDKPEDFIF